ncbi:YrhK family protein [Glaciecola sp. 1036]
MASLSFFFGSTLFLPTFADYATIGVWLFMLGSALMFVDLIRSR